MSETQLGTNDSNETVTDTSEAAFEAFDGTLADLSEQIPELEIIDGFEAAAHAVIAEFGIKPSLFETRERGLIFCGLVARYLDTNVDQDAQPTPESRELMINMLTVLAYDHSDALNEEYRHDTVHAHELDQENNVAAYDAYTDRVLTSELESAIHSDGLLDTVKVRLGIDDDNEDPYEIRVLSVAHTDLPAHGLAEDRSGLDAQFSMDLLDEVHQEQKVVEQWKNGLKQRGIDFAKSLGRTELSADAWVTVLDGKKTLCVASPLAEKIVSPEVTNNVSYYTDDDRARDMAVLEHEYTHTQGGSNQNHDIIGVNVEELRAEVFAGNKLGYNDMKSFFTDYAMFTGHDLRAELLGKPKGGTNAEIYASIANNVGISSMADVLFALPNAYAESEQSSGFLRSIIKSTGGYDGVLGRLLERQLEKGDTGVQDRIAHAAERIDAILSKPGSTLDVDGFVQIRMRQGVSVGAELIRDYIAENHPKAG